MPSDLDAASFSSMLTACVDISSEEDYPETIGKLLEIAPHESAPSSYPHSKDFVMEFDFTDFAFDSLTSKMFKKRLHQRIKSGVEDFITKYDKWLHFGHAGTEYRREWQSSPGQSTGEYYSVVVPSCLFC